MEYPQNKWRFRSQNHLFRLGPSKNHGYVSTVMMRITMIIELDDGTILTGKPDQFDGKNHGFPVEIFPNKPI